MPAIRIDREAFIYTKGVGKPLGPRPVVTVTPKTADIYFPTSKHERSTFKTKAGRRVTPHQWAVYDYVKTIPAGTVSTYKDVCLAVGGSPRSVGSALRTNPFAPYIPCHRVIASNLFLGGFCGDWGRGGKGEDKIAMLKEEGVEFKDNGYLANQRYLYKFHSASEDESSDSDI
ncbi:hypothetical protein AX16_009322 [Volvariella volvacea WC 439]|nr:hypothetical protein AX16_009322 [Volvariella volvacea WC 439]